MTVAAVAFAVGLVTAIWGGAQFWYYATAFALGVYIVSDRLAMRLFADEVSVKLLEKNQERLVAAPRWPSERAR